MSLSTTTGNNERNISSIEQIKNDVGQCLKSGHTIVDQRNDVTCFITTIVIVVIIVLSVVCCCCICYCHCRDRQDAIVWQRKRRQREAIRRSNKRNKTRPTTGINYTTNHFNNHTINIHYHNGEAPRRMQEQIESDSEETASDSSDEIVVHAEGYDRFTPPQNNPWIHPQQNEQIR
eukprot:735321_1